MSSSSDENLRIILTAFPNLSPDEASAINVMQSTMLNKKHSSKRRRPISNHCEVAPDAKKLPSETTDVSGCLLVCFFLHRRNKAWFFS